jgi:hypothetical protein
VYVVSRIMKTLSRLTLAIAILGVLSPAVIGAGLEAGSGAATPAPEMVDGYVKASF